MQNFVLNCKSSLCVHVCVFTGHVQLGEGVSADDVQDVEQSKVDSQQDDTQHRDIQHLTPAGHLTTHVSIIKEMPH